VKFEVQFLGATKEVTGSLYLLRLDEGVVLLECGLVQGSRKEEARNRAPFPFSVNEIDAVVLSHAHIDHSGRSPLLVREGYTGPIYAQRATHALCQIMLPDSGYLHEKDADWENKRRARSGQPLVKPIYTRADAEACLDQFEPIAYDEPREIVPGLLLRFRDAGHILGSSIVELVYSRDGVSKTLVFSGDLGHRDAPVMEPPATPGNADLVMMESTYGDRLHRPFSETINELAGIFREAGAADGNILIPAFTVGRTQDLLYLMIEHYEEWALDDWDIYLDSPMAIEATKTYSEYQHLYGASLFGPDSGSPALPNLRMTMSTEASIGINEIRSGAIIIAGSGMCSGGRIRHHLKNNIWRPECHLVIVGFQAYGTLGRRLVDGAQTIKLWGEAVAVHSSIHTIGGLSAHADQQDLLDWYGSFKQRPPVYLVHGEVAAQQSLAGKLRAAHQAPVSIAEHGQTVSIA